MAKYRPCAMCNWMSDRPHDLCRCTNPDSDQYNKTVHTEDGTCEHWTIWTGTDGVTQEQVVEWLESRQRTLDEVTHG